MIYGLVCPLFVGFSDSKRYDRAGQSVEVFQHPDFVKEIIAVDGFAYTACSDENIRQWSLEAFPFRILNS